MDDDTSRSRAAVVAEHLRHLVAVTAPGRTLPSVRELSRTLSASPVTIGRVVAELAAQGLVVTQPGRGTVVATRRVAVATDVSWQPMALPPAAVEAADVAALDPGSVAGAGLGVGTAGGAAGRAAGGAAGRAGAVALSSGYLSDDLQPRQALGAAASRSVRRGATWAPAPAAGLPELRELFAAQVGLAPTEVLITAGSQSALTTTFRALAAPGDAVLVENPTYPGALAALRAAHLVPVPVPTDADGVRVDDLEILLVRTGARLVYLQTHVANPTGVSLSAQRRRRLLEVAAERGVLLVDDDWARHMSLDPHPSSLAPPLVSADEHGHVIHVTSLAKPVAPSLRVGFIAARGPALARLHTAQVGEHLFTTRLLQEIAVELLTSPDWPRHLRHLARELRDRRDHLLTELAAHWPTSTAGVHRPSAGHHLWVPCPPGTDASQLTATARELGIVVGDGSHYFPDEPTDQRVRMSYGASSQVEVSDAVLRLARAVSVADATHDQPSR